MKKEDVDQLKEVLSEVLHERRNIDDEQHKLDHDFVRELRERRMKWERRFEKFRMSIIGTLGAAVVTFLIWVGKLILDALSHFTSPS